MADLQELFSRLKAQSSEGGSDSPHQQQQQQQTTNTQSGLWAVPPPQGQTSSSSYQQPSVISSLPTPQIHTPDPRNPSNIISPVNTPGPDLDRTNNLLNLLKFNGQTGQQQQPYHPSPNPFQPQPSAMGALQNVTGASNRHTSVQFPPTQQASARGESRPLSAADLMGNLPRSLSHTSAAPGSKLASGPERTDGSKSTGNSSTNPQDFLLNLLKGPKGPPANARPVVASVEKHEPDVDAMTKQLADSTVDSVSREPTPARQFGSPAAGSTPFEAPQPTKSSMFSYVNPFDQLHSSSPLNRAPKTEGQTNTPKKIEILKHDRSTSHNGDIPAAKSRKIGEERDPSAASDNPSGQSVAQALEAVGEQVEKQAERALNDADNKTLSGNTLRGTDEETDVLKKEQIVNDDVESSWESAEDDAKDSKVEVYNFPMKPFVSIQIQGQKSVRPIRQDNFMVISQLKKDFDQIDRCLVTASQSHIVYAQIATKKDNGGFRIIRQDSGDHKQIFRYSGERIFSVQLCSAPTAAVDVEVVLGTGIGGSVFWTSLSKSRGELFADDDVEAQGFIMPAVTTAEENTSGSPVKTRAKMSSRHPDFFAVARGKQIFIIAPGTVKDRAYCDPATNTVNSEKYFADHSLKITTGKAGKDFCFSEDDTVIVSLDKNGRFKFWDVRELTSRAVDITNSKHEPVELREPLWQMTAAASGTKPDEKPSVSSIMLLDKERPVVKGSALRYMIIGFKQNHILQLWDLGLGKAVQEIRMPHEKDSDGICSITYHPKTGIVAIGHPTRNSIYFVHLSAPKYNVPHMEQARYISMLARADPTLPKPESTAIMSGLREFSFAKIGELRSVDMLKTPVENASERNTPEETLFELYAMHSKGSVGISIKRDDLGWDANSKMINPKDAVKEGVISVSELHFQKPLQSEQGDSSSKATTKASGVKKAEAKAPTAAKEAKKEPSPPKSPPPAPIGTPRMLSPEPPNRPLPQIPTNPPLMTPDSYSQAAQRAKSVTSNKSGEETSKNIVVSPRAAAAQAATPAATQTVAPAEPGDYHAMLSNQFDSLYQRIDSDKRVQDAAAGAKQDALLRLVSSTLTENVDRSLSSIIANRIEKDVIPTLTEVTSKVCDRKIAETLPQQLNASVAQAMKAQLSNTLTQALKDKEVHKAISEITANQVAIKVQQQVSAMLQQQLPAMTTEASKKLVGDLESRLTQHQRASETQRQYDNAKIEELSNVVKSLSATLQNMATSQTAFQEQILRMQREARTTQESAARSNTPSVAAARESEAPADDPDITRMYQMLIDGKSEEATIQWISSDRQAEIFDKLFVRVNPTYLGQLSPLVALTVSAAITSSFDTHISERLDWLTRVLQQIDVRDQDIMDVAPQIMNVLSQRLQGAYMTISEARPNDPCLRDISALNRQVQEIRRVAQ